MAQPYRMRCSRRSGVISPAPQRENPLVSPQRNGVPPQAHKSTKRQSGRHSRPDLL